ncbi:LysR family transcriptional regulator [Alteromonas sp. 345S023]|uniref:LysR family transcriptional regulator n=1 Tax=Alteromonas profundi TaxID=2696062 RepID=A0A7X5LNU0_9ALTE|nr:LysR family transcriptional regulator [Alteromonas profundi]NDV92374.1 LysR family transcriptional regulator [Alteromonas profundi]
MNFKQLHYFLTTVNKGSIAAAARELDIAQPAISQQLASLERELGGPLLTRSFSGVTLTPAGKVFFNHAIKLVDDLSLAKNELSAFFTQQESVVKVGMLPSIGNVLSMPLIAEVKSAHPKLKLEISTGPSYAVKSWLETGQIDIALTYEQEMNSKLMSVEPLIREDLHLVTSASPSNPEYQHLLSRDTIAFWEMSQFSLLSPSSKDALGRLIAHYEKLTGVSLQHDRAYSGQLMTGLRQVMQGEGVMILPTSAVFHLQESNLVKLLKIVDPEMPRMVLAATNKTAALNDASAKILSVIKQVVAKEQALNHWCGTLAFAQHVSYSTAAASGSLMSSCIGK